MDCFFVLKMLIPVFMVAIAMIAALILIPDRLCVGLEKFGRCIEAIALLGIVSAITLELTGIPCHGWIDSIHSGIAVVGSIIIVLPGAYVFIALLDKVAHPLFHKIVEGTFLIPGTKATPSGGT